MNTPTHMDFFEILRLHSTWLAGIVGGVRADLTDADLTDADLTDANLTCANLRGANLRGANLTGAIFTDANLTCANLRGANLTGANLTGADLARANLRDVNLRGADLTDADLTDANLTGTNLTDATLTGTNLTGVRDDIYRVLEAAPAEVPALLDALRAGRVDGSCYQGECCCLVGTLAKARGCDYRDLRIADAWSPAERWFLAIRPGHTAETSQIVAITVEWVESWLAAREIVA